MRKKRAQTLTLTIGSGGQTCPVSTTSKLCRSRGSSSSQEIECYKWGIGALSRIDCNTSNPSVACDHRQGKCPAVEAE